jgi:broad specificity phosphatase PhoE
MSRLFIVRHGQTAWNLAGRAQGHTDVALDEVGKQQAAATANALAGIEVDEIWCSDLLRCRETVAPIAMRLNRPVSYLRELRERAFGDWEGEPIEDIRLRFDAIASEQGIARTAIRPPSGESLEDVAARIAPLAARLRSATTSIVVVSHGGVSSVLIAHLLGESVERALERARGFRLRNSSITELVRAGEGYAVIRHSDVAHLGIVGHGSE